MTLTATAELRMFAELMAPFWPGHAARCREIAGEHGRMVECLDLLFRDAREERLASLEAVRKLKPARRKARALELAR